MRQWCWCKWLSNGILSVRAEFESQNELGFFWFRIDGNLLSLGIGIVMELCILLLIISKFISSFTIVKISILIYQ